MLVNYCILKYIKTSNSTILDENLLSFITNRVQDAAKQGNTSRGCNAIVKVRRYLEEENCDLETDPLEYWFNRENEPEFHNVVEKYFSIPATSVPSERIFSKAGNLVTIKRSKLKSKNVNMLIFISKNKWLLD